MNKYIVIVLLSHFLIACGGGSSTTSTTVLTTPVPADENSIIAFDRDIKVGQAVDLFLYFPNKQINNIRWIQTSGAPQVFLAKSSKAIAFTPQTSGTFSFEASFSINGSAQQTLTHTVIVSDETSPISARLGHAVNEGNKVSLRASIDQTLSPDSIIWRQTSGPSVSYTINDTDGEFAVFFNAPAVDKDTLLSFDVSASNGSNRYTDTVAILVENKADISTSANTAFTDRLATVFPHNSDSPYADTLVNCVYNNTINFTRTCTFADLPLIAHDTTSPSIQDIMDRVVVSHQWMGQRFQEFLENYDHHGDFKKLLRATTAIVISYDIRPSFYWAATGAIYLDADYFWLTPDERDTINQAPDYRASFGDELNFEMPWRYVKDNAYVSTFISENNRTARTPENGVFSLISLLYHELAHANDFFPSSQWFNYNSSERILDAVNKQGNANGFESNKLDNALPLFSQEMKKLAQVRFRDPEQITATEKAYQPEDVASFFSPDRAPQFYNYSSIREDYAMLFDGFMMKARYGIDRDVAVTNQPKGPIVYATDYIVIWGQRGRIGDAHIKPRVTFVTERVLPEFTEASAIINNLAEPIQMVAGNNWLDNLNISPSAIPKDNTNTAVAKAVLALKNATLNQEIQVLPPAYYEKPLPIIEK